MEKESFESSCPSINTEDLLRFCFRFLMTKNAIQAMAASPAMAPMIGPISEGFESSLSSSPFPAPMSKLILTQLAKGHWQMLLITSTLQVKPVEHKGEQRGLHVGLTQGGVVVVLAGGGPAMGCDISARGSEGE